MHPLTVVDTVQSHTSIRVADLHTGNVSFKHVLIIISLSPLCFNGHFPGGPGLAGTRMSPFVILLELRMMEVVVTTGAIRRAKLQLNRHHQQTPTPSFITGWIPFLSPNQHCQSTEEKLIIIKYNLYY